MAHSIAKSTSGHKAALTEHVEVIRSLGKQTIANVIEIGRLLAECKKMVGHRNFGCWLDREFGWSERTAQRFLSVHELAGTKSDKLSDLELPVSSLYLLAAPSTPEVVRNEIIARAESGEKITHKEVQKTIAKVQSARKPARSREGAHQIPANRPRPSPREYELKMHEPTRVDPRSGAFISPGFYEQAEGIAGPMTLPSTAGVRGRPATSSEWREQDFSQKDRDELVQARSSGGQQPHCCSRKTFDALAPSPLSRPRPQFSSPPGTAATAAADDGLIFLRLTRPGAAR
jgi:hypothetical protein